MTDIIYVDDEPEALMAAARAARIGGRIADHLPHNLDAAAIVSTNPNLWVFDFFNTPVDQEGAAVEAAAANGLSVFQRLRYLAGDNRPPAALVSNHLEAAVGTDVNRGRRHILAEELGVEWIAPKIRGDGETSLPELLSIANATALIREKVDELRIIAPSEFAAEFSHQLLSLPRNASWRRLAIRDAAAWRPPNLSGIADDRRRPELRDAVVTEPSLRAARIVVAWMIRQVLHYPSFLVSLHQIAARIGVTSACLNAALRQDTRLRKALSPVAYKGILADLVGARWWSAGVDSITWNLPRAKADRTAELERLVAPAPLAELEMNDPVVVYDSDLVETDEIAPAADCVRASDEHFPPHAPPAWVRIDEARGDRLLALKVRLEDQDRLEEHAEAEKQA